MLGAALLAPATAAAQSYPEPKNPGTPTARPKGKAETHTVCRRGCDFTRIQRAVNAARAGDTIRIRRGTYREGVRIAGARKSYIKLIGDPRRPERVVLEGRGLKGLAAQNAVAVDGADGVELRGLSARNYKVNGFFVRDAVDYTMRDLVARRVGTYGIYAFNSKGGEIADAVASEVNDGAFYIGQTPPQNRPMRTLVRNVTGHTSVIGFTGTNMRYVTITKSRFYNNAIGVTPNGLDSERFPPPEDNAIVDNDIFWNNFNFHRGAPFPRRTSGVAALAPVGTGILLLGGRRHTIENNRIFGNYLVGVAAIEGILLEKNPQARALQGNVIRGNQFGLGGTDRNGRDVFYDGNGSDNCMADNAGVQVTVPADGSTMAACPHVGANAFNPGVQLEAIAWSTDATHEAFWVRNPHAPRTDGITPLEVWRP